MLDRFVPDKYFKSIYDIDYDSLKQSGIKCLIFDISNTLEAENVKMPSSKVKDLFEDLKKIGFKLVIMSNNFKKEVIPFKELLCVDSAYLSFKPFKKKYKTILKTLKYKDNEVACIGDQMLFDVLGANRMNLTSVLVNPISNDEYLHAKFNRKLESIIIKRLEKRDLFKRGRYYE